MPVRLAVDFGRGSDVCGRAAPESKMEIPELCRESVRSQRRSCFSLFVTGKGRRVSARHPFSLKESDCGTMIFCHAVASTAAAARFVELP